MIRPVVLESWIWRSLYISAFDAQSEVWAGEAGKTFRISWDQVRQHATPDNMDSFQDWRVQSSHLISQLNVHDKLKFIECLARKMVSKLKVLASSAASHGKLETMEREAVDIFRKAVELDEIFRLSRSDYQIFITRLSPPQAKPPDLGFDFDTRTMEIIRDFSTMSPPEKTTKVDLAISPGILKAGNADGTNYGTESILAKLRALCNLKELLQMFAPDPNSSQEEETHNHQVELSPSKQRQPQIKTKPTSSSSPSPIPTPNVPIKKEATGEIDDEVSMLVEPVPEETVEQQPQDQTRSLCALLPQLLCAIGHK
ncbi:hypothetical protein B0J18DRAFT_37747 [Chaetomium sp. MPI-SDFR-AT-0129]|nr:hypothetical protein B0J18DRAFT_37747 [Chaetomium sp. MPI-SDFR-AT-0129]